MRYALAIVHTRPFSGPYLDSMMGLVKPADGIHLIRVPDLAVDDGRNLAVRLFLETKCEWLLQVDDDMGLHPQTLQRLASRRVDVVAGMCSTRTRPPIVGIYRVIEEKGEDGRELAEMQRRATFDWLLAHGEALGTAPVVMEPSPADAMVEVDLIGTGCLLVNRRVFEALEDPWFVCGKTKSGEDFYFARSVREAGFQMWIDRSVVVGHEWGPVYAMPRDWLIHLLGEAMLDELVDHLAASERR